MRSSAIVMNDEFPEDQLQVPIVDRNQVVQAFSADRPNDSLAIGVGFGSANRRSDWTHTKILQRRVQ